MKEYLLVIALLLGFGGTCALADQPTREETFKFLSQELSQMNADAQDLQRLGAYPATTSQLEDQIQERVGNLLERANRVRDYLAGNPHVQVTGFSITIPWGVSLEFTFPPRSEDQAELKQ